MHDRTITARNREDGAMLVNEQRPAGRREAIWRGDDASDVRAIRETSLVA